jgi:hypothetical protein
MLPLVPLIVNTTPDPVSKVTFAAAVAPVVEVSVPAAARAEMAANPSSFARSGYLPMNRPARAR